MAKKKVSQKPSFWKEACTELSKRDKVMKKLIDTYKDEAPLRRENGFHTIVRSIVGQQISVKAADSIWNKLMMLTKTGMLPAEIIKVTEADLRKAGLSGQKVQYIRNAANFFLNDMRGKIDLVDNDHVQIAEKLIEIKGVGKWTVEMFMIFHMHAPDIFPITDLVIVNATRDLYKLKSKDRKELTKKVLKISERWAPYRSVASWYLWRSVDPVTSNY